MRNFQFSVMVAALYALLVLGCSENSDKYLDYALRAAGRNRAELEHVLTHYADSPEKLAAARYLIENMPGHYSYQGSDIDGYYDIARQVLASDLSPTEQRDSLLGVSEHRYPGLEYRTVPDVRVVSSEYLIHSIDDAFSQWKSNPWAAHVSFDEFCRWILPYKAVELQPLDYWRDTLRTAFSPYIDRMVRDDDQWGTTFYTVDAVRNGILDKVHPVGMFNKSGYPLLRADLLVRQTYGRCEDYVNLAVLAYRSFGIPVVIDYTPYWGRYRAGHSWYTLLSDRGEKLHAEWDVGSVPGTSFFPDKRIPKVYRSSYAINRDRARYKIESEYGFPFELCAEDVTDEYFNTTDVVIDIPRSFKTVEDYAYISTFNGNGTDWCIVDYGHVKDGKAKFRNMGRNVLYIVMAYDGSLPAPVSQPFIIRPDGRIEFIIANPFDMRTVTLRRKYYQSNNVARMRERIRGAEIQASNRSDFRDAVTLYSVTDIYIPDKVSIDSRDDRWRYWRYKAADGTYGSLAELAFMSDDGTLLSGTPISCDCASSDMRLKAFDNDWLTNFETESADGAWVGMDFGHPVSVSAVRIVPRSDDNDIHPGDEYELKYWHNSGGWVSRGRMIATDNTITVDSVPAGALMWLSNHTRGWDERPFLMDEEGNVEWW